MQFTSSFSLSQVFFENLDPGLLVAFPFSAAGYLNMKKKPDIRLLLTGFPRKKGKAETVQKIDDKDDRP